MAAEFVCQGIKPYVLKGRTISFTKKHLKFEFKKEGMQFFVILADKNMVVAGSIIIHLFHHKAIQILPVPKLQSRYLAGHPIQINRVVVVNNLRSSVPSAGQQNFPIHSLL